MLIDAANDVGTGTSKANTAILHTGFDAVPGSLESRLLRRGYALLGEYARRAGIPVEPTGALLVAWTPEQHAELPAIEDKARRNGVTDTHRIGAGELYRREPQLGPGALGALVIPGESIICPWTTPLAYATQALAAGARLRLRSRVTGIRAGAAEHQVVTGTGVVRCRWVVNAAGLHSDAVDAMMGGDRFTICPRRGELIVFDKLARPLLSGILLPVPTARTKGVLVAPTVYGNVLLGPTAEDVPDRGDVATTAAGLASLMEAGHRILPGLAAEEVTATYAGLRAATADRDYQIWVRRFPALRVRGRDPVHRAFGVAGHRRVRHRAAGRCRAAPRRAPGTGPAGHAVHRPGGDPAVPGRRADRRRPGVRRDRVPLRTGHPGRDQGRAGRAAAARRPRRAAPQDPGAQRPLPGLLLRRHGGSVVRRIQAARVRRRPGWAVTGRGVTGMTGGLPTRASGAKVPATESQGPQASGGSRGSRPWASTDVLIVGAGPAGLAAAVELRRLGAGTVWSSTATTRRAASPGTARTPGSARGTCAGC